MGSLFLEHPFQTLSVAIINEVWREMGGLEPQKVRDSLKQEERPTGLIKPIPAGRFQLK